MDWSTNSFLKIPPKFFGTISLLILVTCLVIRIHELGNTAVFGHAFLWGESSNSVQQDSRIVWFVDSLEVLQHLLFATTIFAALLVLVKNKRLIFLSISFLALLFASVLRSYRVDGLEMLFSPEFVAICAWVAVL